MDCISIGAEARIYVKGNHILKERVPKQYRIKALDDSLRKFRTRREAKVLSRLEEKSFPAPRLVRVDETTMILEMTRCEGVTVKSLSIEQQTYGLFYAIGQLIGALHSYDIIHGDLTTSNMLFDVAGSQDTTISFIDFGLSYFSQRLEDKAVELHLCFEAIESTHYTVADRAREMIQKGYEQTYLEHDAVLERLGIVENRGRYKQKAKKRE